MPLKTQRLRRGGERNKRKKDWGILIAEIRIRRDRLREVAKVGGTEKTKGQLIAVGGGKDERPRKGLCRHMRAQWGGKPKRAKKLGKGVCRGDDPGELRCGFRMKKFRGGGGKGWKIEEVKEKTASFRATDRSRTGEKKGKGETRVVSQSQLFTEKSMALRERLVKRQEEGKGRLKSMPAIGDTFTRP